MKIVILDAFTTNPGDLSWDVFLQFGALEIFDRTALNDRLKRSLGAEVLLTNKVVLDAPLLDQLPNLRYIGVLATGTNVVDLEHARQRGVAVTNIPQYSTESVVQTTFAHILNLAVRIADNAIAVRSGEWQACLDFSFTKAPLTELFGKTLGIIGAGAIGRRTAEAAQTFGMNVLLYGPRLGVGKLPGGCEAVALDYLLSHSDVISLHCPLTPETRGLISRDALDRMKPGAWLINTGRGPLLDEEAVAEALKSGRLGGLGCDVLSTEPPADYNPLLSAPNCYITPHNAWASFEARRRLIQIAADNLAAFLRGEPVNVVN